ncbi:hypothetical protein PT300_10470 [Enterobacteriaceae bacterium ESL0689]|nr:hypothetical protein [Enterobacteriaceae bacterium ESL0689]
MTVAIRSASHLKVRFIQQSLHDVEDKFPYEVLHPQHGIEILAGISFGSKTKYRIKLIWDDNYKKRNEEEFFVSI